MSEYVKLATGAGDQFLAALAESQETFLKSLSTAFSSLDARARRRSRRSRRSPPSCPTPKEVVEANFAFASKLLKQQKDFTEKFFAATAPPSKSAPPARFPARSRAEASGGSSAAAGTIPPHRSAP